VPVTNNTFSLLRASASLPRRLSYMSYRTMNNNKRMLGPLFILATQVLRKRGQKEASINSPFKFVTPNERRDFLARPNRDRGPYKNRGLQPSPWRKLERALWIVCVAFVIAALSFNLLPPLSPYLSAGPVKSWYALNNGVPVERVQVEKKPHDCEYDTAPIGSKHCHYDAKVSVWKGTDSPGGMDYLLVSFERIEE
jgi:hypothetical protein